MNPEVRTAALSRLRSLRESGRLSTEHVRLAAGGLGVTERSVWRWLEHAGDDDDAPVRSRRSDGYELSDTDREAFAHYRGNITALHRARTAALAGVTSVAGAPVGDFLISGWAHSPAVALRTLQRAFAQQLTPAEQAFWREGESARRAGDVYLTRPPTARNQVWELDHKELPILVLPPRGPAVKPWLTSVIDDGTRVLLGWAIMFTPHTGTVLTALRMALTYEESRGPYGGIPSEVRIDRGLDFAAQAVADALAALCVKRHRLPGYTAHRKGKIERIHQTIEQTLLCGLPGYTKGPRDASGTLYGPLSDAATDRAALEHAPLGPMRVERFVAERFAPWVTWYNTERPHAGLHGSTPLQAWNGDPSALERIDASRVRHLLMADMERTINKDGIRHNGLAYVAAQLQGRRGQKVQIRFMPHDDRSIEVYLDGVHLCTAFPQGHLSAEEVETFRAHARAETKKLSGARRRASARTRAELVPLTTEQTEAADARLIPAAALTDEARRRATTAQVIRPRSDLLGLHPPRTVPAPPPAAANDGGEVAENTDQPDPAGQDGRPPATTPTVKED